MSGLLAEASLYPALDGLLNGLLEDRGDGARAAQQARTDYGVPDFVVVRQGLPVGYVEAKRPGAQLAALTGRDRAQLSSFLNLDNVLYTDMLLQSVVSGDTLGRASLLPLDPVRMSAEDAATAADELDVWADADAEALLLADEAG